MMDGSFRFHFPLHYDFGITVMISDRLLGFEAHGLHFVRVICYAVVFTLLQQYCQICSTYSSHIVS